MKHCNDVTNLTNCPIFKDDQLTEWLESEQPCNVKWEKVSDMGWDEVLSKVKAGYTVSIIIGEFEPIPTPDSKTLSIQEIEASENLDKLLEERIGDNFVGILTLTNEDDESNNPSEYLDTNC